MKKKTINILKDVAISVLILTVATGLGVLFKHFNIHKTNVVVVYIFSVLLIARITKGYLFGILSSVVSLLLFNLFFTEPYFTLKVNDMTYIITFAIMTFTSIVTSALTTKVKKAAFDAKEREKESNALYHMTNHLTDAEDENAIAEVIVKTTSDMLSCNTSCICFDEEGNPENTFLQGIDGGIVRRQLASDEDMKEYVSQFTKGANTTEKDVYFPIYGKLFPLAVLRVPFCVADAMTESQSRMFHSIIESASLALERLQSVKEQTKTREEAAQERYRGNLLRAISHDIRTPLSGIMGTSEMLMGKTDKDDQRYALAKDIYKDAEWLHGLVENILNLTKLQDGKLILDKQLEAVEEVIGAAVMVMEKRIPERSIDIEMPDQVIMAPMDAKLISQVLVNLLDNATKHTCGDCEIKIAVKADDKSAYITVSDNGKGIAESDLPHVFKMFYTTGKTNTDSKRGVGLGLAICQSIIEAHGGKIYAENLLEGGAAFTFTLPLGENL